ncbi:MAG: family 10 glycosylhydrolase, partial [Cyanobacteria bacterium P01_F01_bin.42]
MSVTAVNEKYLQDWTRWAESGLIDEALVQVYLSEPSFLQGELDRQDFLYLSSALPVGIGLYTGPRNNPKLIQQIQQEVAIVQEAAMILCPSSVGKLRF